MSTRLRCLRHDSHAGKGIAVLTSGGDSQGMNAAVRAVVRCAIYLGCNVYFIREGYQGMVDGGNNIEKASWSSVSSIIQKGGTIIGSARSQDFREHAGRVQAAKNLVKNGITNLVVIGGDGSLTGADTFKQEWPSLLIELKNNGEISGDEASKFQNLKIVGLVGSIDNDFCGTDMTIGTDSALHRIMEAVDAISSTAYSHQRTFIMEVMGRHCGYLALVTALASEADYVFLPEDPLPLKWPESLCKKLTQSRNFGQRLNIIIVAEGALDREGQAITAEMIKKVVEDNLNQDTRITVLGHVQRGGNASAFDRIIGCRMGIEAVITLMEMSDETIPAQVITLAGSNISRAPLMECVDRTKSVARAMDDKNWDLAVALRGRSFARNLNIYKMLTRLRLPSSIENQNESAVAVAILHVGAPACGMNAVVRSFVRISMYKGLKPLAISNGIEGLIAGQVKVMDWSNVNGYVAMGGALLGAKRTLPGDRIGEVANKLREYKIAGLVFVGGFESLSAALQLVDNRTMYKEFCIPIIVVPSTISNNVPGTEVSIGADTALNEITEISDRIRQSAQGTKRRAFIIETMGGHCGYLATVGGLASGADAVYIFEEKFGIKDLLTDVYHMASKMAEGVERGIILRNERCNDNYSAEFICRLFTEEGKGLFSTRMNILGHMQQGGSPTPYDRNLGTKMGAKAVDWLSEKLNSGRGNFTSPDSAVVMGMMQQQLKHTPLEELRRDTDFENRIPKNQWWIKLRPLIKILAKHKAAYTDEDLYIPIQEFENTELWHEPSRKIAPWQMSSSVEVGEEGEV